MNGINIGMTTTVTTPTTVTAILAIAASTSPISIPTATLMRDLLFQVLNLLQLDVSL